MLSCIKPRYFGIIFVILFVLLCLCNVSFARRIIHKNYSSYKLGQAVLVAIYQKFVVVLK